MSTRALATIIGALVVALGVVFGVQQWRVHRAQAAARTAELARVNDAARRDTTRDVALRSLDSTLHAVERLTVQQTLERDRIDRELKRSTAALTQATVEIQQLRAHISAPTSVSTRRDSTGDYDVRTATFDVRQPPHTVHAVAELPLPPRPATLALTVSTDPAEIDIRNQCGAPNAAGIRPAINLLTGPDWLTMRIRRTEQSREVCNASSARARAAWWQLWKGWRLGPFVGPGYGLSFDADSNVVRHGFHVTAGVGLVH